MHLLWRAGGYPAQDELWSFIADDLVRLHLAESNEWERIRALMQQYADLPMDLADASLVAAAERTGLRRVFSLDRDFHVYRPHGTDHFHILP
jgi:hypothetical protein